MKKYKPIDMKPLKYLTFFSIFIVMLFFGMYQAWGATAYVPIVQSYTGLDTLKYIIKERGQDIDSATYEWASFPVVDSIPLTIGKHYDIIPSYFWNGETAWLEGDPIAYYVAPDLPTDLFNIRYVDADASGNNTGLNWTDAWTHPDSISSITTGDGYTIYVDADEYDPVDACSLKVANMSVIGVNGLPVFHYNTDTIADGTWDTTGAADVSDCIYVNAKNWRIENIKFTGEGLYAFPEYGADPDGNLSTGFRGGKNAIFMDSAADFGTIYNCQFDSAYKPVASYYREDSMRTAAYGVTIKGNTFRDVEYHAIDAALARCIITDNDFIVTNPTQHAAAGAVQLISRISGYNLVYNNRFHGFGYGAYSNVSDSNFFANNYFGSEVLSDGSGQAIRGYDTGYYDPMVFSVDNHIVDNFIESPVNNARNLLVNPGFEVKSINRHYPAFWGSNDWSTTNKNNGASFEISPFGYINKNVLSEFTSGDQGHSLFIMNGNTDAYMYQNSDNLYLDVGNLLFSAKVLPNSPIVSGDTIRFALFEDTLEDGTFSLSHTFYFTSDGGTNWEDVGTIYSIANAGTYYFSMSTWNIDSGDGFYFDDLFLGQYAGGVTATANFATADIVEIADTLEGRHGSGAWTTGSASGTGSDTVIVYAIDTSGTDTAVEDVKVTVKNASGTSVITGYTDGTGAKTFYLDPGSYTLIGRMTGYAWVSTALTVSGNSDSTTLPGYDFAVGSPSSASLCRVYGWLSDLSGNPMMGATITASRIKSNEAVDSTGGVSVISGSTIQPVYSDSTGYWYIDLRRTTNHVDTTLGFYNIVCQYGTEKIFDVKKLYIPAIGNLNLADSLAGR